MTERFLTFTQVARELAVTRQDVVDLVRTRQLIAVEPGGKGRIERCSLEQLIDELYEAQSRKGQISGLPLPYGEAPDEPDEDASVENPVGDVLGDSSIKWTPQQSRVLRLLGEGLSNSEIARELGVEITTVKSHVSRILSLLSLPSRERLIALLWRSGYMSSASRLT